MPGAIKTRDKLSDFAVTFNQKMRTDRELLDAFKVGMFSEVELILEKLLHFPRTELTRRQADVVDNQQGDLALRARIEVG